MHTYRVYISLSLSLYIYIYIYRERDREIERERERDIVSVAKGLGVRTCGCIDGCYIRMQSRTHMHYAHDYIHTYM